MRRFLILYSVDGVEQTETWYGKDGPDACEQFAMHLRLTGATGWHVSAFKPAYQIETNIIVRDPHPTQLRLLGVNHS